MSVSKFNPGNAVFAMIVIAVAALRIASFSGYGPFALFTPLGAMALFAGTYFQGNIKPFLFSLATLLISDLFVSSFIYPDAKSGLLYSGWYWTYASFALITLMARFTVRKVSVKNIAIAVLYATLIHWLVSDFGLCVQSNQFTIVLYFRKLSSAIPWELRFMAGTALFSSVMFGLFELLQRRGAFLRFLPGRLKS